MATVHWLEDKDHQRKPGSGHINKPRMTALTVERLVRLKNMLSGNKNTVYEEHVLSEERNRFE